MVQGDVGGCDSQGDSALLCGCIFDLVGTESAICVV